MKRRRLTIRLPREVRGEGPWSDTVAPPGVYVAEVNPHGALWVKATNGHDLGVKPNEYEPVLDALEGCS